MKFESFSFLSSIPIHEEAKMAMHRRYGHDHVCGNPENSDSRQEAYDQPHTPEKLSADCQEGQRGRNVHGPGKEPHRASKSRAAKPSQHLLCSMCEKDDSQDESQNHCGNAVVSGNDCADHVLHPSVPCIATALSGNARSYKLGALSSYGAACGRRFSSTRPSSQLRTG